MAEQTKQKNSWIKRLLLIAGSLVLVAGVSLWYLFNEKHTDTAELQAEIKMTSDQLLKEFIDNHEAANARYAEKIMLIKGRVTEIETADTLVNLKFIDSTSGSYAIFAFQDDDLPAARLVKAGDQVAIKGSCSGGAYSEILETVFINFKRCVLVP